MLKTYYTEINPTIEQITKINKTIGVCRFVYNLYLATQQEHYEVTGKFLSGYDFSKWLNNVYVPNNNMLWIKEVSSKAVKKAIMNGEQLYKNFFKKLSGKPKFKKKNKSNVKAYFPKNSETDLMVKRHKVKVPTLGWIRLKEYGYLPVNAELKSCTISKKAGKYFISLLAEVDNVSIIQTNNNIGIGVDLGIKTFAVVSSGLTFGNINKSTKVKNIEKKLKREQRSLSRKLLKQKESENPVTKTRANIDKNTLRVQKLYVRLSNIREEYVRSVVDTLVKTKPEFITIENLNIRGMIKNRHLSKLISSQLFYRFKEHLINKCKKFGIELRMADRFYASSKTCSLCGYKHKDLKLKDRVFKCPNCGKILDRDYNASLNLQKLKLYTILT